MIAQAAWGDVALTELVWTILGIIGTFITYDNMRDARKYIEAVEKMNGKNLVNYRMLTVIAFGHYRDEMFRLIKFAAITAAGVALMLTPPADAKQPISATQVVVFIAFFTLEITMLAASALDRRQREIMRRMR